MGMEDVNNNICHPKHYNQGGVECIDAIKAATVGKTGIEAFCVGNVIKYLFRYEEKNGLEDVKKAKWYIERLIKELEPDIVEADEEDKQISCRDCVFDTVPYGLPPCINCRKGLIEGTESWEKAVLLFKAKSENNP